MAVWPPKGCVMAAEREQIAALRDQLDRSGARWEAADNPIARLAPDDIRLRLGADPPADAVSLDDRERAAAQRFEQYGVATAPGAPAAIDWRNSGGTNFVGPVRDQKNCGSCVAFGVIATVEAAIRVKAGAADLAVDLSEAHLFYCHGGADGRNCGNGWWPNRALDAFKSIGVVDENCFPYTPGDQACRTCDDWRDRLTKITDFKSLTSVADMKAAIATTGPLVSCFAVYDDFPAYNSGVYHRTSNTRLGGHCICIVGYDDAQKCWIAKNSWGSDWGESGFFRIGYGEVGIDFEMWSVETKSAEGGTWLRDKIITGLWVVDQGRSGAAFIDGVGWKRLAGKDSDVFGGMLTLLAAAKSAKSKCNLRLEGDVIVELYSF
jgi:C1A family cysteine protease